MTLRPLVALCSAAVFCMSAGASTMQDYLPMEELQRIGVDDLQKPKYEKFSPIGGSSDDPRIKAVKKAAIMVGAQHGFNQQMEINKSKLRAMSDSLDQIFDFRTLMKLASGNQNGRFLIPAIMGQADDVKAVSTDASVISISEREYQIVRPARLALRSPNWREYLLYDEKMETTLPSELLLPKDEDEREIWESGIKEGWSSGSQLAEREMVTRMERMGQDFFGIIRNIKLKEEGKLQQTLVTYEYDPVSGGGSSMSENRHVYRIAAPASLNGNMSNWRPIIMSSRDSLAFPIEKGTYVDPMGGVE